MKPLTLTIIREEHSALAAMLRSIPLLLAEHRRHGSLPDFAAAQGKKIAVGQQPGLPGQDRALVVVGMGAAVRKGQRGLALADTPPHRQARLTRRGNSHLIRR